MWARGDLQVITMRPVLLDLPYNDLAFIAKGKMMVFIEAQSTWTVNILQRLLLYYADTLKEYIAENKLDVYHKNPIEVEEPEFFIVFTGKDKIEKDFISLREDFFHNAKCRIELEAKVIYQEDKSNIIGQYIIFCHIFDRQRTKWGSIKKAVEETIRICKDEDVLTEYLTSRAKEVVEIMNILFDQDYAMERRIMSKQIETAVHTCMMLDLSKDATVELVAKQFDLTPSVAEWYVDASWKEPVEA